MRAALIICAVLALAAPATVLACNEGPGGTPITTNAVGYCPTTADPLALCDGYCQTAAGIPEPCPVVPVEIPDVDSVGLCRIQDANEQPLFVPVEQALGSTPDVPSLATGWTPAFARGSAGAFTLSCAPGVASSVWTDESWSVYTDGPNTAYAYPVVTNA